MKKIKILLSGGGTGGHIYPLLVAASSLRQEAQNQGIDIDMRYFGDPGPYADDFSRDGIRVMHVTSSKIRNYFSLLNMFDAFRLMWSIPQAFIKIFFFMPHVAFTKGGPGTISIILACRFYLIPLVVHESDSIPGKAIRVAAKSARIIELAFENAKSYLETKRGTFHITGNLVREEISRIRDASVTDRITAKGEFGFSSSDPVLFVVGGSQGAERLNTFVLENLNELTMRFQILHQVGVKNFDQYAKEYAFVIEKMDAATIGARYKFVPYLDTASIGKAYLAADLLLSRAGSGAIFEAAATGTPSILVPLPEAAQNHQFENAYIYHSKGAALFIEEENFLIHIFLNEVDRLFKNPQTLESMRVAAKAFNVDGGAKLVAKDILSLA